MSRPAIRRARAFLAVALGAAGVAAPAQEEAIPLTEPRIEIAAPGIVPGRITVLVDGAVGDAFAEVRDGALTLDVPFPDASAPFTVEVRDTEGGALLHRATYRRAAPSPFDRLDVSRRFQNDTVWKPYVRARPGEPLDEPTDAFNDLVAGFGAEGAAGRFTVGVDGEVWGTTQRFKRLRANGTPVDLARAAAFVEYRGVDSLVRFSAGDVAVAGNNPLVSQGFYSRGLGLDAALFDGRVRVQAGRTFGTEVVGFRHGLGLSDDSRRSAFGLAVDVLRDEPIALTVRGSYYSLRRPAQSTFNVGVVPVGERNRLLGAGADLVLLGGRASLANDVAWSDYENPDSLDFTVAAGAVRVGELEGRARRHRLDLSLLEEGPLQASVYGAYHETDRLFRSMETWLPSDRRTWELGGWLAFGNVTLNVDWSRFHTNIDDLPGLLATRESNGSAALSVSLDEARGAGALAFLVPSSVNVSASRWRVRGTNGAALLATPGLFFPASQVPDHRTENIGVDISWDAQPFSTGLGVSQTRGDSEAVGARDADTEQHTLSLSESYQGERLSVTGSVVFTRFENEQAAFGSHDYSVAPALDLQAQLRRLPDVALQADLSWRKSDAKAAFSDALERSYRILGTLDFTKYLPAAARKHNAYLRTSLLFQRTRVRSAAFGAFGQKDVAGTLTVGMQLQ